MFAAYNLMAVKAVCFEAYAVFCASRWLALKQELARYGQFYKVNGKIDLSIENETQLYNAEISEGRLLPSAIRCRHRFPPKDRSIPLLSLFEAVFKRKNDCYSADLIGAF